MTRGGEGGQSQAFSVPLYKLLSIQGCSVRFFGSKGSVKIVK